MESPDRLPLDEDEPSVSVRFEEFATLRFGFRSKPPDGVDPADVVFQTGHANRVVEEDDRIYIRFSVRVGVGAEDDSSTSLGFIQTQSVFHVLGLSRFPSKGDHLAIPADLLLLLYNLAIGATRGALATRGAGTPLEKFIFPIVDPNDFVREMDDADFVDEDEG